MTELVDVLSSVNEASRGPHPNRDVPLKSATGMLIAERVAAAARLVTAIDKARPEVFIDVELLEVDRTRMKEYGLQK